MPKERILNKMEIYYGIFVVPLPDYDGDERDDADGRHGDDEI